MTRRFLALGDSYTIGEGVPESGRWPTQLVAALRAEGMAIAEPMILAKTGWTTDELATAIEQSAPRGPFDLVTLLVGVNDQYRGRTVDAYDAALRPLAERARTLAGGDGSRVVVVSIPDWGATPFGATDPRGAAAIGRAIDAFNERARLRANELGASYVDVTALSRRSGSDATQLGADRLHPSERMYASWVEVILPVARNALGVTRAA